MPTCEEELFDIAGGWDQHDTSVFGFYDVTLKVAIGEHPAGTHFDGVIIDHQRGKIELQSDLDKGERYTKDVYKLSYAIGAKIEGGE